jgi:hypothetical protein
MPTPRTNAPPTPLTKPPAVEHELLIRDSDDTFVVIGSLLGFGSSETIQHTGHAGNGDHAPRGHRCSACRWFEVRIIEVNSVTDELTSGNNVLNVRRVDPPARFLVHTVGRTEVPTERQYVRSSWVNGGLEMVEALTVRKHNDTFIAGPSQKALAIASEFDEGIRDAYVNRAVA